MSKYSLMFNIDNEFYEGDKEVEIGKVIDVETDEDVLYINYDKHIYDKEGYHMCPLRYKNESEEFIVVKVDDLHRNCLFEQPNVFLTMVLHEYGHIINGDLDKTGLTNETIQNDRLRCILEGKIQEEERKADAFAISHVGKNTFMRTMDYMIKKRRERNDRDMHFAIQEFELRKKAAKKL